MVHYHDRASLFAAFRDHVNPGKADFFAAVGFDAVMGRRDGVRFGDEFDDRTWFNCHSNGGVFNLGHRNPRVLAAVR